MLNNNERRGFAIPIAILVIAVLTIMIAGGFSLVSAERRSVADQKSQISAFRIAEQGLELFLVRRDSLMAGSRNTCFLPIGQRRTFAWLDAQDPGLHRHHELPGYSHLDLFFGREAARDVFPLILAALERGERPPARRRGRRFEPGTGRAATAEEELPAAPADTVAT